MRKQAPSRRPVMVAGWREWVALPDLGVARIKAKMDTGARTSALHAWRIELDKARDGDWVRFELRPLQRDNSTVIPCRAQLVDIREIRNSSGQKERRYIIHTRLRLGDATWPIEIGLTNRDEMGFRMLIGRAAVRGHLIVDPGRSFLLGRRQPRTSVVATRRRPGRTA